MAFIDKISSCIEKYSLLEPGARVLVALSGGADSVALLLSLRALEYDCVAAHCNFHLRGNDSNRDASFVADLCARLGIELATIDFDVPDYQRRHKVSLEMACRELRYDWFERLLGERRCCAIAVGHHADDRKETFIINALRGSGIKGLSSIKPKNGNVVRPMLFVSRADIEAFLEEHNQPFVTDITNLSIDFGRNKVRNRILPEINALFPDNAMLRTIDSLLSCNEFYQGALESAIANCCQIDGDVVVVNYRKLLAFRGYDALLYGIVSRYGFNAVQADELLQAVNSPDGVGRIFVSQSHRIDVGRKAFTISLTENGDTLAAEYRFALPYVPAELPLQLSVEVIPFSSVDFERNPLVAYLDSSIVGVPLVLRHWRRADRMHPFGLKGSKLLSDLFADAKYDSLQKRNAWVLEAAGEVIWVPGLRTSDRYRCKPGGDVVVVSVIE